MSAGAFENITGEAYGRRFRLLGPASALAASLGELPPGWRPSDGVPDRTWTVLESGETTVALEDGHELAVGGSPESLGRLVGQSIELWVAEHAADLTFVHAGVVAVDGRAIVLPGPSRSGKSTLVAALVRAGATYFSDEFAPLRDDGMVLPYQRPMKQRADSPAAAWPVGVIDATRPDPLPVAVVAAIRFDLVNPDVLHKASAADVVLEMLANTVSARSRPAEALSRTSTAIRRAVAVTGTRRDVEPAVSLLMSAARQEVLP